jgi:hypothetical protein
MRNPIVERQRTVAGLVLAACSCCAVRQRLVTHQPLGSARLVCPLSGSTYLDRGDGVYEPDGQRLEPGTVRTVEFEVQEPSSLPAVCGGQPPEPVVAGPAAGSSDLLSDRPRRTGEKTRIELERATFAAAASGARR